MSSGKTSLCNSKQEQEESFWAEEDEEAEEEEEENIPIFRLKSRSYQRVSRGLEKRAA